MESEKYLGRKGESKRANASRSASALEYSRALLVSFLRIERSTLLHSDLCVSAWERRYLEDATETALAEESDDLEVVDGEGGFRVCIGVFGVRAG